jgi:hypothetical protein
MDIFIRNVPVNCSQKQLKKFFHPSLAEFGIQDFHAEKIRGKPLATLTIVDVSAGARYLAWYGIPANATRHIQPRKRLVWDGKSVICSKSRTEPDDFSVKALAHEASQRASQAEDLSRADAPNSQNKKITRFAILELVCGVWDYMDSELVFVEHFHDSRQGAVSFGVNSVVMLLGGTGTTQSRIDLNFYDCRNIVLGTYGDPWISFTLSHPPKFYEIDGDNPDILAKALMSMTLSVNSNNHKETEKTRTTSISTRHNEKMAGTCFVYRIRLPDFRTLSSVRSLLERAKKMPPTIPTNPSTIFPTEGLEHSFQKLVHDLTDAHRYGRLPFGVLYQLHRLARNGALPPLKVRELLPTVSKILQQHDADTALSAVRRLYYRVPFAGPETLASELSVPTLKLILWELADAYGHYRYSPENPYQIAKTYTHINLVHKVVVTPAGLFLDGPEPEPTNRVLRRYANHTDDFVRVVFQDEDGSSVRYDPRASSELIFDDRFKKILDTHIPIAGKLFSFLGFSHSSLRAQACWFMAPLISERGLKLADHVLKELGDFSHIRIPAKCAARIGQNFTDT